MSKGTSWFGTFGQWNEFMACKSFLFAIEPVVTNVLRVRLMSDIAFLGNQQYINTVGIS